MRTIKFRVWTRDGMKYDVDLVKGSSVFKGIRMQGELMQFTGLLDKNGKEIYEGDIVTEHLLRTTKLGEINYKIVWYSDYHGFAICYLSDDGSERYIHEMRSKDGVSKNLEIIGNIYENPELIK